MKTKAVGIAVMLTLIAALMGCNRGPNDETLTQQVKAKISADPALATQPVNVSVKDGVVTLAGNVNTATNKAKAEDLAKGVDGVKSVSNSLSVRPPIVNATPPPVSPDTQLKTSVMAGLTKYGITTVSAEVVNGEVTLSGNIPRAKLQDAMKAANESHPKKVVNKMTIK
ncbi:MAG TPA: BON domain-containing protein [Pyrinomonadaceae bacterium]|nr:BON domain-containing protein [Pyrinomonadaceae bacterium]